MTDGTEVARHGELVVRRDPDDGVVVANEAQGGVGSVELDLDSARWLALVGLPAAVGRLRTAAEKRP